MKRTSPSVCDICCHHGVLKLRIAQIVVLLLLTSLWLLASLVKDGALMKGSHKTEAQGNLEPELPFTSDT